MENILLTVNTPINLPNMAGKLSFYKIVFDNEYHADRFSLFCETNSTSGPITIYKYNKQKITKNHVGVFQNNADETNENLSEISIDYPSPISLNDLAKITLKERDGYAINLKDVSARLFYSIT